MKKNNYINITDKLSFTFENKTYQLTVINFSGKFENKNIKRKMPSPENIAKTRFDVFLQNEYVGKEVQIYNISKIYDKMFLKFIGKSHRSLSPIPKQAKESKNWEIFKRLYEMFEQYGYPSELFIKVQFLKFNKKKAVTGKTCPYPNMLYGTWAKRNFAEYVKNSMEIGMEELITNSEYDYLKETLESSMYTIENAKKYFPEVDEWYHIMSMEDSLSPVYLATNKVYLKYVNEHRGGPSDEVGKVLLRMSKDSEFKRTVFKVLKELKGGY